MSTTRRNNILNVLSYVAVIAVGIALLLSWLLGQFGVPNQVSGALNIIAECIAYLVIACYSFTYVRTKGVWWLVAWVVAVVLIVVFKILGTHL